MWVEISHWKNKGIRGVLENDPELVPDCAGEVVEIREEDVFDYIHKYGRTREGNTTGELIEKMEKESISLTTTSLDELSKRIAGTDCGPK